MDPVNGDMTTCTPTCGDGKLMPGEVCDDSTEIDGKGCKLDCTGDEVGWKCTGGDQNNPVTCVGVCGDGHI